MFEKHRIFCAEECHCEAGGRTLQGTLRNLSGQGMLVRTSHPFPVGEDVQVKFRLEGAVIQVRGTVRHSQVGYGMGIHFISLHPRDRDLLQGYFSNQLERLGPRAYSRARRAPRFTKRARVTIRGRNSQGERFSEEAETVDVSDLGARLALETKTTVGDLLALKVLSSGESSWGQFRIVWEGPPDSSLKGQIGLELNVVDFWGLHKLAME